MSHDGHSHVTVEDLSLEHFALRENGGWAGVHCESGVWSMLFALLLWDVLFASVPDVFRSPFQSSPLDLGTDAFAPARAELLKEALSRLRNGEALEMLEQTWKDHRGRISFKKRHCFHKTLPHKHHVSKHLQGGGLEESIGNDLDWTCYGKWLCALGV